MGNLTINISGYEVLVSSCDYGKVISKKWRHRTKSNPSDNDYFLHSCKANGKTKTIYLHRYLMDFPKGFEIDHINGNTLDNTRENLRICTHAENTTNRKKRSDNNSSYKGVSWNKNHKKWLSFITVNKKQKYLGYFDTPQEAYAVYCEAAKNLHGKFARLA
jgi:hypothetical protein